MEPDETEIEKMIEKGTKAWAGVPDNWVDELRGGPDMREAFEHWFSDGGEWPQGLVKSATGKHYKYAEAENSWHVWQAAWDAAKKPRQTT